MTPRCPLKKGLSSTWATTCKTRTLKEFSPRVPLRSCPSCPHLVLLALLHSNIMKITYICPLTPLGHHASRYCTAGVFTQYQTTCVPVTIITFCGSTTSSNSVVKTQMDFSLKITATVYQPFYKSYVGQPVEDEENT